MDNNSVLFLRPAFGVAIWGDGTLYKKYAYTYDVAEPNRVASIRAFSGHPHGTNLVENGTYAGKTLAEVYDLEPELFGNAQQRRWEVVPIMMGVCHAADDLSIQVHPTEEFALRHENSHGKSESWYIMDCGEGADVVLGHRAQSLEELDSYIAKDAIEELVLRKPIAPGDFFNLKAGTLHALQKGTTFIEVCTCCDLTYRFYDYHRRDEKGNERKLDIEKARQNILIPYEEMTYDTLQWQHDGVMETQFCDNENFSVRLFEVDGSGLVPKRKPYFACFVISGSGQLGEYMLRAGDCFMVTSQQTQLELSGNMEILAAHG